MNSPAGEPLAALESRPDNREFILSAEIPRLCDGVMEAAWLAVVVLVPCQVNLHSLSGYEPNKITLLRLLVFIIAAAGMIKFAGGERSVMTETSAVFRFGSRVPFVLALGVLALSQVMATVFSINPQTSLWGLYETAQGSLTFGCGLILFAALAAHLHRQAQVGRLVTTIIIVSFPLALYGLIERAGYDSIPRHAHTRVMALFGHPMYFAACLLLVMPLCLGRILNLARELRAGSGPPALRIVGLVLYGSILVAEVLAFVLTESRGAFLGLIAGLVFFVVLLGILQRRRVILLLGSGFALLLLLALILLNLPGGPFQRWTSRPILHRLSQVFSQKEAAAAQRLDYWAAAVKIMTSTGPLALPAGNDPWHRLRPLVGYGPETVESVLAREYSSPGPDVKIENRLHNLVLDTWLNLGAPGAAALLAGYALVFLTLYQRWRWVTTTKNLWLFLGLVGGVALGTAAALVFWRGPGLVGLGLQWGLAGGLALYPFAVFLLRINPENEPHSLAQNDLLLLALLSALFAHLVETAFSFETAATTVLVWVYLAVILALLRHDRPVTGDPRLAASAAPELNPVQKPATPSTGSQIQPGGNDLPRSSALIPAAIIGVLLVSLLFTFIQGYSFQPRSLLEVLAQSLTQLLPGPRSNPCLLPVLFLTWFGGGLAFTLDLARNDPGLRWRGRLLTILVISGLMAGAYAALKGFQLVALGPVPDSSAPVTRVLHQASDYVLICLVFLGICVSIVFWSGWLISRELPRTRRNSGAIRWAGAGAVAVAALLTWVTTIRFLRADVSCSWADALCVFGDEPLAEPVFDRVLSTNPQALTYRGDFADHLKNLAQSSAVKSEFDARMAKAEKVMLAAPCNSLDRGALVLGELYLEWAAIEPDPATRLNLAKKAGVALAQALELEPKSELVWRESAAVDILFLNREDAGRAKIRRADELVRNQNPSEFADYYAGKCRAARSVLLKRQYGSYALEYYDQAIEAAAAAGASTLHLTTAKAGLKLELSAYDSL